MGKILVIAEKPSVGRDYARVLKCKQKGEGCLIGDRYIVTWAVGHLVELCEPEKYDPRYKKWNYQDLPIIPDTMKLQVIKGSSSKQFTIVQKLMNSDEVDSLICGTDSGREGELIFRYIYQVAKCTKPFQRLWVSSMTDEAISKGFETLKDGKDYDLLYESAKCRSEADWLVGINSSRAYTIQYDNLLSIGRVQTPTLSMIVNRQKEIDAFIPKDYFEVRLTHPKGLNDPKDLEFTSTYFTVNGKEKVTAVETREEADRIRDRALAAGKAVVVSSQTKPNRQLPPLLYDLTQLQRDANRRYGFSASKTLNLAQSLYEKHKLLTYPRTDSRYISDDMKPVIRETLHKMNIPEFHPYLMGLTRGLIFTKRIVDNTKITDHHAVIPTNRVPDLSKLTRDEALIYKMAAMRLIEVFYPAYEYDSTEVILQAGQDQYLAKGRVIKNLGFMALRQSSGQKKSSESSEEADEKQLPLMKPGQIVPIKKAETVAKQTQPPKPFTEATLLGAMEFAGKYIEDEELKEEMDKLSLGTPATRAAIIERLIKVNYIIRKGKALYPTEKGKKLIQIVPAQLKSPEMTGKWERSLDKIYQGSMDPSRFMGSIDRYVDFIVKAAGEKNEEVVFEKEAYKKSRSGRVRTVKQPLGVCPLCGGSILKNSKAYYCSNWKEKGCKFTVWLNSLEKEGSSLTDTMMKNMLAGKAAPVGKTGKLVSLTKDGKLQITGQDRQV